MKKSSPRKSLSNTELVRTLIRLLNISQGKAVDAAGLTRQNVSTWLTGRESSLTNEKKLHMLSTLGVLYHRLRSDVVHRWCVTSILDVADVLSTVVDPSADVLLWEVDNPALPGSAILRIRQDSEIAWVILYRPSMDQKPASITPQALGCGQFVCDLSINKDQWESWLPPAQIEIESFKEQMDYLISTSSFPLPSDDQDVDELESDYLDIDRADISEFRPTQKDLDAWYELLVRAKMQGMDLDDALKQVKRMLGLRFAGEK